MKKTAALFLLALPLPFAIHANPTTPQPVICSPEKTGSPCQNVSKKPSLNLGAGNPIHLITGNKYQQETDLPMRASGLEFVRYYNSLGANKTLLGEGWSHSYETRLWFAGGKPQIVHADGSRTLFQPRQGDTALAQESNHGKLIYHNQERTWTWQLKPGLEKTFNAKGRLIDVKLPGLATIRIIRDETPGPTQDAILEVHGGKQEKLVFHYETIGKTARLSRIETPAGLFLYRHDQPKGYQGQRLTGMLRPDNMGKTYFHEPEHQHGNPFLLTGISIHDSRGKNALRTNSWSYNDKGKAIRSITGPQEDTRNRIEIEYINRPKTENALGLTRVKNTDGQHTDFHTSIKGGKYVLEAIEGAGCHGCAIPGTKAEYDSKGRMTSLNGTQIHYDENDNIRQLDISRSPWAGLQLHYDEKDRPVTWSSKITGAEHTRYNDRNLPVEQKFANGDQALFEYDKDGHLVKVMESTKNKARSVTTKIVSQPKNNFFAVEYSDENNVEKKVFFTLQKNTLNINTSRRPIWVSANRKGIEDWMPSIRYDDEYIFENEGKTKIHHLPEGGYISYFYNENNKPETIIWTEQSGKKHHLIMDSSIPEKGYVLGNQLAFHALKTDAGQTQLSLWNKDKRFWTQTLDFSEDNTLRSETVIVPDAKYEAGRNYAYDPSQRMISTKSSAQYKEQDLSGQHHYAWNKDGSSAAYYNGSDTIKPAIERDASGLPLKINEFDLIYDASRRLRFISKDKKPIATYLYNALGQRILKKTPNSHTYYYYENNKLSGEWTTYKDKHSRRGLNGNIDRRYIYAGNLPVAFIEYEKAMFPYEYALPHDASAQKALPPQQPHQSKLYFIHTDHIGQPFMVTDQEKKIHWLAHNSPTGKSHILHADIEFNLRLPGQYYDKETGWHYNMNRYYDPGAGHYLEPDPIGPVPNNDPFGYAAQQPRLFIDPLGLLLFAFDGTENNKYSNTNVLKFTRLYIGDKSYTSGTGKFLPTTHTAGMLDAALGYNIMNIINHQINELVNTIPNTFNINNTNNPLLPIDIIAFSRGSAIALIFANMLADHTDEHGFFSMEWTSLLHGKRKDTINACLDLRFIGLFDNVPQIGYRGNLNDLYTYTVPDSWDWIAHAASLNEHRKLFPLTPLVGEGNNWIEQGFIGAHSDVGGFTWQSDLKDRLNPKKGQYGDLGDIPLAWMVWQAEQAGVSMESLSNPSTQTQPFSGIDNPVLHGTPARSSPNPDLDRYIQEPGSNATDKYQREHATLGQAARQEVEKFITRFPVDTSEDSLLSQKIIGTVDATHYVTWLENELGWDSPF